MLRVVAADLPALAARAKQPSEGKRFAKYHHRPGPPPSCLQMANAFASAFANASAAECSLVSKPTLLSRLIWFVLRRLYDWKGWQLEQQRAPPLRKYILLGAPHTSNWDFVFFAGATRKLGILPRFMGKHTLFAWPMTRFMYDMGGMPVDRSRPGGYVQAVVEAFAQAEDMALVIAPEGTRSSAGEWRTGFYRIAMGAGVPIVPAWVDHATKQGGLGEPIMPTGDYKADLAKIAEFYRSKMPGCARFGVLAEQARALAEADAAVTGTVTGTAAP